MRAIADIPGTPASGRRPATAVAPWLLAAVTLGGLSVLLLALVVAGRQPLLDLDRRVADSLHSWALAHPGGTAANRILTDWVWDPWTMRLLLAAAVVWLWFRGDRRTAFWTAAAAAACTGLQQLLKAVVGRERPVWERPVDSADFAAMPSGHAMTAAFTCVVLLWLTHRAEARRCVRNAVLVAAVVSVAGVSVTRVVLGVHWMTDTLTGSLLGAAAAAATAAVRNHRQRAGESGVPLRPGRKAV